MPDFLSSFWGSDLPKRMLRYALMRLELLDTDELDMDKLDFTLGRNTVVAFQDVGIKLQKLERLLSLPANIRLQRARVLSLRLTIPAAIYSSPIVVEVDGVQIKLRVGNPDGDKEPQSSRDGSGTAKRTTSGQEETEELVPHAIDLAQSFLETQPVSEKAELQAALQAETQDLGASIAGSEDGSDEESTLGTGQALSLPAFLANFLQGIADRTEISIKGVTFEMDVQVPLEPTSNVPELVTFQLGVDGIDIEGVPNEVQSAATETESPPRIQPKEGKRLIVLNSIRACLISEANVFSTLARTPSMYSSSAAATSPAATRRQSISPEPADPTASISSLPERLEDSAELDQSRYYAMMDSEDAFNIPYELEQNNGQSPEPPATPRATATELPSHPVVERPLTRPSQSTIGVAPELWASVESNSRTEPLGHRSIQFEGSPQEPLRDVGDSPPSMADSVALSEPGDNGLEQSQVFSHEEAESMYMSAFSDARESQTDSVMQLSRHSSAQATGLMRDYVTSPADGLRLDTLHLTDNKPESIPEGASSENDPVADEDPSTAIHSISRPGVALEDSAKPTRPRSPDEIVTPRGPTRLVKELVSLASVAIHVPSKHQTVELPPGTEPFPMTSASRHHLDQSMAPNMPGAFSVYSPASADETDAQQERKEVPKVAADGKIEVSLAPLDIRFDLSTGFLLAMVVSQIMTALKLDSSTAKPAKNQDGKPTSPPPDMTIAIEKICLHFMETLTGVANTAERALKPATTFENDALLSLTLDNLVVGMSSTEGKTLTSVDLAKFRFGYGNDDIISLDQRLQMRASVRDAFPSAGSDVSLNVTQTKDSTRCEVKTLPIHVKLDLQRLDETFSWFGGLSSFLNMSSSMTSSHSTQAAPRSPVKTPKKPSRGVRFDAPIRPDDTSANSENKVNVRLSGFHLDLVGKECSLSVDTSAVKVVSREEGVGIGISKIEIAGPLLRKSMASPPIQISVNNARIEYLVTPKDVDLERLLELITPSKYKFDQKDDEIMVDTLLRQRRKGAVLRLNVDDVQTEVSNLSLLHVLPGLGEEIARLSTVAKYLPEDDRPGILTLGMIRNIDVGVDIGGKFGSLQTSLKDLEVGHISVPSLVALGVGAVSVHRNHKEELIGNAISSQSSYGPAITMRIIADEMEPVIRLRMRHINVEYRVPTIMDILGLGEETTPQEFEASLASSVANLGEHAHARITGKKPATTGKMEKDKKKEAKPTRVDIAFRDCLIGLNPLNKSSKLVVALTDAHLQVSLSNGDDAEALTTLNKASLLLIDDVALLDNPEVLSSRRRPSSTSTPQIVELCHKGFVDICYLSSAKVTVQIGTNRSDGNKFIDIELRDDLLVLETCADSTQTLIGLANALAPPTPPSKETKYRTKVVPMQDMLASISADAFGQAEGDYDFDDDFGLAQELGGDTDEALDSEMSSQLSSQSSPLDVDSHYYEEPGLDSPLEDPEGSFMSEKTTSRDTQDGVLLTNFSSQPDDDVDDDDDLVIHENYFGQGSVIQGTAHRWNSAKNEYDEANDEKVERSPVMVRVRDVHVIWNLFDGYDWSHTRDVISEAVADIEAKAYEREAGRDRSRLSGEPEMVDEETVIGDFLFNSIYIGIPANRDPRELAAAINQELNDNATETESIATTAVTATPSRQGGSAARRNKKLKLNRSKRHKITFELQGIDVDLITFPPGSGETQSSIDVRIRDVNVFDHVPTSTWKKFLTYDQDAGEREMGTSMAHLEILTVKPLPELGASEFVIKAKLLPLRLHVDQDALDFITRFFEFKDESAPVHASPSDIPFVQRAEVDSIPVNLDFKPKRVDYTGLRSGRTTEFMNFIVLDEAHMVLRHTIIYGVRGFDRLGQTLNDIWMPDVKRNQLPGILAGLAPIRSIVNVGSGFKNLVEIPIKEYQKDGRIVRSIGKGAAAFAKTTGTEMIKLGAKLAVGTQYALQGAEGILTKTPESSAREQSGYDDFEADDTEDTKQISLYADQPTGVVQGLRGAYSSLRRDLNVARDAIIAVPGEVMESQNAQGAARAVLRRAPTIIFRPLIGSTKAIGQTLMGATNSLDPQNRRRADEKYKRH